MSDLSLSLREAPAITGLTFRPYRGPEDFPSMVAVYDASRPVDGYDWPTSVEDLARSFAHLDHCDPHADMIFAAIYGEAILRRLRLLQERGMTEAALGVDTENISGALRLYERCGFRPARSGSVYRKPFDPLGN